MKTFYTLLLSLFFLLNTFSFNKIVYLEPQPNAKLVSPDNNIIIRFENPINLNEEEIIKNIVVYGSLNKIYSGKIILTEENKKVIFKSYDNFGLEDVISVKLTGKLARLINRNKNDDIFQFTTAGQKLSWNYDELYSKELSSFRDSQVKDNIEDFPQLTVNVNNNPSPGNIFLTNTYTLPYLPYLIITNNNGSLYYYQQLTSEGYDFKKQPNGNLTYFDRGLYKHFEMNTNYNIVNSYYCGNGYTTNVHELRVLNNGHAYVMAYDPEIVDMSQIVPGGSHNATVVGLIIQEIDQNKTVVFQWRSWDHYAITDAWHENMLAIFIDYVHGNSIEIDADSNLIISSRNLDEITKINHITGDIIWRFGGKNNQFTFIGDTLKFTYQHAARRISNGNITLFDNGNFHTPHYSRAVEYQLDEINKTAHAVWQYRHSPDIFSPAMGYAQRLANGNTLIGWGQARPSVTEVTPSGTVVFEMSLPVGIYSYRVYKYDWSGAPLNIDKQKNIIPSDYSLYQNFPNPFNPSTSISFSIPRGGLVKIVIFDLLGNEVKTILNEYKNPGAYSIEFEASSLASGVYFYKMITAEYINIKKMVLIK